MRKPDKQFAPAWVLSMVRRFRRIRSQFQRQLARLPGFHATWVLSQRLRFRLLPPRTLNEKIRYRMAHDRREILVKTTDKIGVRDFVEHRVGNKHLTVLHTTYACAADIVFESLPRSYVMKATHASGATLLVDERAPHGSTLPPWDARNPFPFLARVHPDSIARSEIRRLAATWIESPYGGTTMRPQWAYQKLLPQVMFEELLDDGKGNSPLDYKFLCFNGEPTIVQVFTEREQQVKRALYTPTWQRVHERGEHRLPDIDPPEILPDMLRISRILAKGFDFVRVDLYAVDGRVVVGELTHYPAAGRVRGGDTGPLSVAASSWLPNTVT